MASDQMRRENKTNEREVHVEREKVPKMASHFESLSGKDRGEPEHANVVSYDEQKSPSKPVEEGKHRLESITEKIRGFEGGKEHEHGREYEGRKEKHEGGGGEEGNNSPPSLEEISKYRGQAQQNSMEAIRAAEERYENAKKNMTRAGETTKEEETEAGVGETVADKAAKTKDFVVEKAVQAKDSTVDVSKKGAGYVGEKTAAAAGYVGQAVGTVKDKAVVAGWGAAEYTAEKVVGATEAVVNVTAGVAGYTGEKVVAAKDVVADVGGKAKGYVGEKLVAAKDTVVSTEESAKEYAARKRAEKEKEMEAKKAGQSKNVQGEGVGGGTAEETLQGAVAQSEQVNLSKGHETGKGDYGGGGDEAV